MVERVHLAQRLVVERSKPKPTGWAVLAKREGIPERTLRHVHARYVAEAQVLSDPTGLAVLEETLLLISESIHRLAQEVERAEHPSHRIGAIRLMLEATASRVQLLAALGRIPRNLQAADEREQIRLLMDRFGEHLETCGISVETIEELIAITDETLGPRPPERQLLALTSS